MGANSPENLNKWDFHADLPINFKFRMPANSYKTFSGLRFIAYV